MIRSACIIFFCLAMMGCARGDDAASPTAQSAAPTNRVDIPAAVRRNLGITFAKVEKRRIGQTLRVPGHFELLPEARHEYRATLPGRVEFLVRQYQSVEAGTPLYRLQSPQWPQVQRELSEELYAIETARSDIAVAEATLEEARTRINLLQERMAALAQAEVRRAELEMEAAELNASLPRRRTELQAKQSMLAAAQERFDHAVNRAAALVGMTRDAMDEDVTDSGSASGRRRWQMIDWIEVAALQPGVVETIALTPGGWAESASLILTTANPALLRFRAVGLQADLARLRAGAPTFIMPPHENGPTSAEPLDAELTVGLEADPATRTMALLAIPKREQLPNWARPGVSAFLEIETTGTSAEELVIPRSAVIQDGLVHVLFRRDPANPDQVVRLEADLGMSDGRWVVIHSGVKLGDEVVLDGVYELKLATSGQTTKGGHFHADGTFHAEH